MKSFKIQSLKNLVQSNRLGELKKMAGTNRVDLVKNGKVLYGKVRNEYEDMYEMTSIKKHHEDLLKLEQDLHQAANKRRFFQSDLNRIQENTQAIRDQILKIDRKDSNYVNLILRENELAREEDRIKDFVKDAEQAEKELFSIFSNKLKVSYQLDLIRQHKQRLLSVICTVFGATITFIITYFKSRTERTTFYKSMSDRFGVLEDKMQRFDEKTESYFQSTQKLINAFLDNITSVFRTQKPAQNVDNHVDGDIGTVLFSRSVCILMLAVVLVYLIEKIN